MTPAVMRIAAVNAEVLVARPSRGVRFAIGDYDAFTAVLVSVRTEDGLIGYGEALARRGGEMTAAAVNSLLGPAVVGEDARNIGGLWVRMFDRLRRWGHSAGVVVEAISGIDCALWDVAGQAAGLPVWRLLYGAGRERVPVYASSIYIDPDEEMVAQAREHVANGFGAIKIKIGRTPADGGVRGDIRVVGKIREAVGDGIELMVDANGAFDAATAVRVGRALEPLDVQWFEEPVPPDDLDGYRRVHAMTSTPLAAGETFFGVAGFRAPIMMGLLDYIQPDLGRCGGMTAALQIAALAFAQNRQMAPHTGLSGGLSQLAAIHLASAVPQLSRLEYMTIDNPVRELFVEGFPRPHDGILDVPRAPGWGLTLDLDRIEHMRG
jgi:L-alanine-DL-glutamate epimerase-like enolase superfamily enzyme